MAVAGRRSTALNSAREKVVKAAGFVIPVGHKRRNLRGRPAQLLYPPMLRTPAQRQARAARVIASGSA